MAYRRLDAEIKLCHNCNFVVEEEWFSQLICIPISSVTTSKPYVAIVNG